MMREAGFGWAYGQLANGARWAVSCPKKGHPVKLEQCQLKWVSEKRQVFAEGIVRGHKMHGEVLDVIPGNVIGDVS